MTDARKDPLSDGLAATSRAGMQRRLDDAAWEIVGDELPKNALPARVRASRRQREVGEETSRKQTQEAQPAAETRQGANEDDPLPGVV
jgi:hypothetical protein